MTIDEALTDLSIQLEMAHRLGNARQANAIKLGIEALKFKQTWLKGRFYPACYLLPGEDPE